MKSPRKMSKPLRILLSIADSPLLGPLQVSILIRWPRHTEADMAEDDEDARDQCVQHPVDAPLHVLRKRPCEVVEDEPECQNGEI